MHNPQGTQGAEALQPICMNAEAAAATDKALHACLQKLAKVKVIDTHDHILSAYDRQIAVYATEQFNRQGINLVLNCRVSLLHEELPALRLSPGPSNLPSCFSLWVMSHVTCLTFGSAAAGMQRPSAGDPSDTQSLLHLGWEDTA